jgi:Transposase DDE domain
MARTIAELPAGSRITDHISLGVIARTFPVTNMQSSYREVLRCLLEGVQWLLEPSASTKVAGNSGISQARTRLGWEPLRQLHDEIVKPIAVKDTKGAWYRGWRLVSLDGSTLDVADEKNNDEAFGRPGASRGASAYPQIRFVSLAEIGTHVLFGTQMAGCTTSEIALSRTVLPHLERGMLCLADRNFFGFSLWAQASATGAELLWRVKKNLRLVCEKRLPDGSYLSRIFPSERDWRHKTNGVAVRVIDYRLDGVVDAEPVYRLVTTILDYEKAPATELAVLYHKRWEIETAFDELKTHLRGARIVLRSKTPDLVRQEFYGLLMAHFAVRGLMLFLPPQRKAFHKSVLEEILQERVGSRRNRRNPRGVKRKMTSFPLRPRHVKPLPPIDIRKVIRIVK